MDCLNLVQGDSFSGQIEVFGLDAKDIAELKFVCADLGWTYHLGETLDPTIWYLFIPSEDTKNARVGRFGYNIVAELHSGRVVTALYNARLEIKYKDNKWTEAI